MSNSKKALQQHVNDLAQERDVLLEKCKQSEEAYSVLMHQLKEMLRYRFGQKSRRYVDSDNPQLSLYEDNVIDDMTALVPGDHVVDIQAYQRRKKTEKRFADNLPRKEMIIPVAEHDKTCECGCQKKVINYPDHERLNYLPPVYEVIIERREIVACPKGCEGEMVTADKPKHILPKAKFTASVLAHIIVNKFDDRQPFYHLEKKFKKRAGFTLARQTMARATIECSDALQALVNLMKDQVIGYDVGALDATTLQVLNETGRPATRKSYVYLLGAVRPEKRLRGMNTTQQITSIL